MSVIVGVVAGWIGFNVLFLAAVTWATRGRETRPDIHETLDNLDVTNPTGYREP